MSNYYKKKAKELRKRQSDAVDSVHGKVDYSPPSDTSVSEKRKRDAKLRALKEMAKKRSAKLNAELDEEAAKRDAEDKEGYTKRKRKKRK